MIKYLQLPTCKLAEFSAAGDTSFTVSGFLLNDGITPVASADIGDICYATLEPKTVREELISFTIVSVTSAGVATVTAVRGLLQKSPYTTGGATFDHQNGSDFVISNNPGLFNQLTAKDNLEVITAQWSFPSPTANASPVTKAYADALVINGGAEATNTTRGIALLSASPDVTIGTATISIATPAVVSFVAHGLLAGDSIRFTTTGALPTGLVVGTRYFVMVAGLVANAFQVSLTVSGAAINTSGTQSGVHTLIETTPIAVGYNDTTKLPTVAEKAAMVGYPGTPANTNKFKTQNMSVTAGATIAGASTPVPVYQDITAFKFLACIANDTTKIAFQGFATSSSTDTNPINVQHDGIVGGFTGLTRGVKYYLQDTSGLIGVTPGTYEIEVGIAISTTELLVARGKRFASGSTSITTATTTTFTLGFRPSKVTIMAINGVASVSATKSIAYSQGGWTKYGGNQCIKNTLNSSDLQTVAVDAAKAYHIAPDTTGGTENVGVVAVTDTGFTITSTTTGTITTARIYWDAEGEF